MMTKQVRMDIDQLAFICDHFTDCETNNGYGCNHPKNVSKECHRIGCPFAWYDSNKDKMVIFDKTLLASIRNKKSKGEQK
jgi:hypothetical protein